MNTIDKARQFLIKQDITSFEIDIPSLKFEQKVIFDTCENYAKTTGLPVSGFSVITDGCTFKRGELNLILTRHKSTPMLHRSIRATTDNRLNWTLAHEVGHVVLGHTTDGVEQERQADVFAGELLMPELVILELQRRLGRPLQIGEVSRLFGVSQSAAAIRLMSIQRRSFFSAYLKTELMKKYEKLINDYAENKGKVCQSIIV